MLYASYVLLCVFSSPIYTPILYIVCDLPSSKTWMLSPSPHSDLLCATSERDRANRKERDKERRREREEPTKIGTACC